MCIHIYIYIYIERERDIQAAAPETTCSGRGDVSESMVCTRSLLCWLRLGWLKLHGCESSSLLFAVFFN